MLLTLYISIYKWILIPMYLHILFIFFLPLTRLLILQNWKDVTHHKYAQHARMYQRHNSVVSFPSFIDCSVLFLPVVAYHLSTTFAHQLREIAFVISLYDILVI